MSPFPSAIRGTDPVRRFVPLREQSDERLVALARGGSDEAFSEIVRRYERPLRGYCSRIVDPVRAEDAVQQAFLQALRALRGPDRRELALKAWLHTIARNCAIDLHTGRTTHTFEELDGSAPDASPSPPRLAEQREELSQLMTGLRRLPVGQRRALLLRELEGRSYEEIGAQIGRTPSGVRQTIFRARTALREAVAVFGPPVWLRTLWPFGGGGSGRSLEALAAAGAAIVAVAGTASLPASRPAPDGLVGGVRPGVVAPATAALAEPSSAAAPVGAPLAPVHPPRPDTPVSRPPLPGAGPPASTGPPPRPLPNPTPGKGTPDGGQTPSVPGTQPVSPSPSAGEQGGGQAPPVSDSGSGSSGSGSSGSGSSGSGSSGSGSSGSGSSGSGSSGSGSSGSGSDDSSGRRGRRGHSGSGSGSSGSDSSGSGSDGSGSSGSGSSDSGSSGSGSSDSGSSGSGSSDSGSDDDSAESER